MQTTPTLQELATEAGVHFGYALRSRELADERYRDVVLRDANAVGSEFEMVTRHIRTADGGFCWPYADALLDFAEKHRLPFYGHDFLHNDIPPFITAVTDRGELIRMLRTHIETIAWRYRGRVPYWHIGTELFVPDGMRKTHWHSFIGPDYLDLAFRIAHAADPTALLMLNEARVEELSGFSDTVYDHVRGMLDRGVPVHGMGFHALRDAAWAANDANIESMQKNWSRFAALGLDLFISEMGLYIPAATPEHYQTQARGYENIVRAALEFRPRFRGFIVFGVADHLHWTVYRYQEYRHPLMFDQHYTPKPAHAAVRRAFADAVPAPAAPT